MYHVTAMPAVDTIPTEEEQATGLERREFEAMVAGNMVCVLNRYVCYFAHNSLEFPWAQKCYIQRLSPSPIKIY